ncbi:hypothetical protein [Pseudaminobacter soli (ex Li et al. 2025)]|uniref:hypothetical protein n=1 Tax=Pseudaminobacter soli (ex Li et al. 2025) TaxID=1295366 RepID=UPI0015E71003|nr:hypothetical protein [Mesorhizobium soli]
MNAIIVGYEGKRDLFETIGYLKPAEEVEAPKEQAPLPEMNPQLFQALFAKQ